MADVPALLTVRGLNVFYGHSHALQGVEFTIHKGVLAIVGRNGMGKTTLCKTIMGLTRASSGSIRFGSSDELTRLNSAQIARLGIGYVPQGRRLWRSLTVDEHLQVTPSARKGAWTVERIYDTFPRLAERKNNAGGQLSGGEQQMLAISRALLANPRLLVMDEPTEGLAPLIVAQVEEMLVKLAEDGEMAVLVIEQNIGVACAVSENVAIMVNGRINRVIEAQRLAADRALQQRLLGVGRHGHDDTPLVETVVSEGAAPVARRPASASTRIYVSNPALPTRWSQPVPVARIEATARTTSASVVSLDDAATRRAEVRPLAASGPPVVLVAGTLDTKGEELRFIRDLLKLADVRTRLVDLSTGGKHSAADVSPNEIALNHPRGAGGVFSSDRGASVAAMAEAFEIWMSRQSGIAGIISAGGSGATALVTPAMRRLPVGVPKIMISTVASGEVGRYVGASDIMMMYSVTDVQGLNVISRQILANGAQAIAGMVKARIAQTREARGRAAPAERPAIGLTMFGVTTPCVQQLTAALKDEYDCLVFHATGTGGQSMEKLVDGGQLAGRDRHHDDGGLRPADGRRVSGDRGSLRRDHPRAHPLCRLGRRARHGQLRPARDGAGALSGPPLPPAQSASDADAHHAGRERAHGPLDRRAAEPDGCAGALPVARGRRVGNRQGRRTLLRPGGGRRAVPRARTDRAADLDAPARARAGEHQRSGVCDCRARRLPRGAWRTHRRAAGRRGERCALNAPP